MLSTKLKEAAGNSADATLYVDDVFSTYLYTGNGSTQTINNGIDLAGKGGAVWIKSRDVARNHLLSYPGNASNFVIPNSATDPGAYDPSRISAFSSTGFSVGSSAGTNGNTEKYASWTFREAAKFFDVVTYTGTGSARTIAHSLGVAPGMIIVKCTSTIGDWRVYSNGLTNAELLKLNTTDSKFSTTAWNNTSPTASVFSLGGVSTGVNDSGQTYVAYLFAHDTSSTGIIQCGSYTGNGGTTDATGQNITLGWEPQYLLVKSATTTSGNNSWAILDTMRGWDMTEGNDRTVYANTSAAENAGLYGNPTSTGFRVWDSNVNASGVTYIYIAIRMPNKPPTLGTQVYNADTRGSATATANNTSYYSGFPVDLSIGRNINYAGGDTQAFDRLRGNPSLWTNLTNAESAQTYYFDSNKGFYGYTQTANTDQLYWMFKRAPGFFDQVCYTGTGVATTQAHNLGVVPELIIIKSRGAISSWATFALSVSPLYWVLNLNTTESIFTKALFSSQPTSSTMTFTGAQINAASTTYVAYLFATLAGISKVGSYTGNGTGQAIACGFSAGARFVLVKRTDSTGNWYTFDSARGLTSGSSPYLLLNSQDAQVTGNNGVYASTGGFTLGATAITTTNIATATYIFLAVA